MPRRGSQPADRSAERTRRRRAGDGVTASAASNPALAAAGLPEHAIPPKLRDALARLTAERDRLRAELAKARSKIAALERLADEDALTPVANRRAFVRQLSRMIAFCRRYDVSASLIYFDINNMKQINDLHGHAAGDAALRHAAVVLRDNIRSSDIIGRLGGDEFGIVLAQSNEAQAHNKGAALSEAMAAKPLDWGPHRIAVSAAYGVYAFSGNEDAQGAVEAADRAMYRQKRTAPPAEEREDPVTQ